MTGYFGKVSTHGDFVSRRLPAHLVQAWDKWLQECMHASQAKLGAGWLERYLTSPVWRFAIAPGVIGPEGLGGVLMPSVDRVGRYFPLMVGAAEAPPLLDWFNGQANWYGLIEGLARESLDPAFTLDRLDQAPDPAFAATSLASALSTWRLPWGEDMSASIANVTLQGHSLWWTDGGPYVAASLRIFRGMPQAQAFGAMLDDSTVALD